MRYARGGTITGLSVGEGGKGITHPVVQEAYDNVPNDKRSDPRMHGRKKSWNSRR